MKKSLLATFLIAMIVCGLTFVDSVHSASNSPSTVSASDVASMMPTITWNRTYVGSNSGSVVIQTEDGGFLLGSATLPILDDNVELLKVDSLGNPQWNKTYMGTGNFLGKWLVQTSNSGYAFTGQYAGGFWLAKTDGEGNLQWNQTYIGAGYSWASSVTQTSDGGYALTGQTNSTMGQTSSSSIGANGVIWLLKTDGLGNEQWSKTLGDGTVNSVIQTSDGGYALIGGSNSDYLLIKTNSTGDMQWTKIYGSQDKDFGYAVVQTSDGGYALGGWMWLRSNGGGPNLAIVKTDALGTLQWTQYYGGGQGWAMVQTSDGGFAIAGTALVKIDAAENEQWELSFEGNQVYSVIQTQDGGYAVAGGSSAVWLAKISLTLTKPSSTPSITPSIVPSLTPSPSVPEFPSFMVVSFLMVTVIFAAILYKAKHNRLK